MEDSLLDINSPPKVTSTIWFGSGDTRLLIHEGLGFAFDTPMPNRWRRFWYRVLLGWTWESTAA